MQDGPISDVHRLKELLFEPESQALIALRERIDALSQTDQRIHQDLLERLRQLADAQEQRRAELARLVAEASARERQDRLALEQRLAELVEREDRERGDIVRRLDSLLDRAGTAERFQASVAASLHGALREAEVERHRELAEAIAPLVIRTIKTEIRGSHDELADALYPHMGRMVKSYVASAMKDLADQINRRLEQNPLMLRLRSFTTGRPVSELAMADSMRLQVEELYLIRRGTGELVGRWPEAAGTGNRDHVLGGTLAAINEFAADALADGGSELRCVDLGASKIYLRASPLHLLAARCAGSAPGAIEQVIDEAFLSFIEQHRDALQADADAAAAGPNLPTLAGDMQQKVAARQQELAVPSLGFAPLKWAAALVLLPLLAWMGWSLYLDWRTSATRQAALAAVASTADLKGYRTHVDVVRGGRALTVVGLTPSETAKTTVLARIAERLPDVEVRDELAVLPNTALQVDRELARLRGAVDTIETRVTSHGQTLAGVEREVGRVQTTLGKVRTDVESVGSDVKQVATTTDDVRRELSSVDAELSRAAERRALLRAASRLEQTLPDLRRLETELAATTDPDAVRRVAARMTELRTQIRARVAALDGQTVPPQADMQPWLASLATSAADLGALTGQRRQAAAATEAGQAAPIGARDLAEDVSAGVERLAAIAAAVEQVNALRRSLPPPPAPPPPQIVPAEPTPRDRLAAFVRDHAVFFSNGNDYRDPAVVAAMLAQLAGLINQTDVLLRVVGYTDERGGAQRNTSLSQSRADKVLEELVQAGVARERLVAVGRLNSIDISAASGAGSPNRRVEFEIGFVGEATRPERAP